MRNIAFPSNITMNLLRRQHVLSFLLLALVLAPVYAQNGTSNIFDQQSENATQFDCGSTTCDVAEEVVCAIDTNEEASCQNQGIICGQAEELIAYNKLCNIVEAQHELEEKGEMEGVKRGEMERGSTRLL